jgi:hypothetical protein
VSRVKKSLDLKKIRRLIWLVLTVFVLLGYSLQSVAGSLYYSMMMQAYGMISSPPVILEEGNVTGASTIYTNSTSAKVSVDSTTETYDYVLRVVNQETDNWTVNLQVYDSSNISRLSSLNISLYDGASSNQIAVSEGSIVKSEGEPYNLSGGAGSTIYISITNLQETASGISYLYVYLKILVPDTSMYSLYIVTFEIT